MRNQAEALTAPSSQQEQNRQWWDKTPMRYDWRDKIRFDEGSREFFEEVDKRFVASSPFYEGERPFQRLIPFERLRGKRLLEIGCGLGLHSQLLIEAGANLTSIDLTPRAANLTRQRLILKQLNHDVRVMDAENMAFDDSEFDFVWSWGVIHHSAETDQIVREVFRVLKPGGEFRCMVYHRRSINAYGHLAKGFLSGKFLKGMSAQDIFNHYSDGYLARFYSIKEFNGLLERNGFNVKHVQILGQKSELIPMPGNAWSGRFKYSLLPLVPNSPAKIVLSVLGGFLFVSASKDSN